MKTMKKVGALLLALIMCLSMSMPAMAASDYTITVENSIGDKTYNAYKIFDAQYDGNAVSYTIDSDSAWYEAVCIATNVFALTAYSTTGEGDEAVTTDHVEVRSDVSDADVIAVFENAYTDEFASTLTASATDQGNGDTLELDVGEPGYYFVTTTSGSVVSLTTAAPTATVIDKNQKPGEGGYDPKDPDWEGDFSKDADGYSYSVGDEVSYTIKSYVPTYDGDKLVGTYTITDTMGDGLTYDNDMTVKIIGTGLDDYEDITSLCTITLNETTNTLTITWSPAEIEAETGFTYPADAVVTIEYTDTVNELADDVDLTNEVVMVWTRLDPTTGEPDPDDPDPGTTEDKDVIVYTYGFDLKKTDGTKVLEGAQFILSDELGYAITFLYDEDSDTYEEWDGTTDGTTTTTITVADGEINIWGLGAGTYTLTETVAPDGYNLLDEPVKIVIDTADNGWTVIVNGTTSVGAFNSDDAEIDEHGVAVMPTVTIENNAGTELPSTGGMGTTIFYVIGAILVCGAGILLITRRRMSREV